MISSLDNNICLCCLRVIYNIVFQFLTCAGTWTYKLGLLQKRDWFSFGWYVQRSLWEYVLYFCHSSSLFFFFLICFIHSNCDFWWKGCESKLFFCNCIQTFAWKILVKMIFNSNSPPLHLMMHYCLTLDIIFMISTK